MPQTCKKRIGDFLEALNQREDVTASSRALYATLAKPLDIAAQRAHAKRLVLWLDGALRYLPFAALNDGSRYLIEKYALQIYSIPARGAGTLAQKTAALAQGSRIRRSSSGAWVRCAAGHGR